MSDASGVLEGLRNLKLVQKSAEKPPNSTENWATWEDNVGESWVDDDFDVQELLAGNKYVAKSSDAAWEDVDKDSSSKSESHNLSRARPNLPKKVKDAPITKSVKLGSHTIGIAPSSPKKKKKEPVQVRPAGKGHQHARNDEPLQLPKEPRSMREKRGELPSDTYSRADRERIAKDIARLTPVAGWKPPVNDDDEEEEKDPYNFSALKEEVYDQDTRPRSANKGRSSRRKRTDAPGVEEKSEIVHIHYSDKPAQTTQRRKAAVQLESRWASDGEGEETPTQEKPGESVRESRERYRRQKIAQQLDWDQGIQHRGDSGEDTDSGDDHDEKHELAAGVSAVPVAEYKPLAFDDEPAPEAAPKKTPKKTPKAETGAVLESMWA